jgi:pyruvate/2-oxoglutarate dehydrogenase complex dihydrolipoamide acyltransferase (E2) component
MAIPFVAACALAPVLGHAEDSNKTAPAGASEPVCGRDLMTPEEAAERRAKERGVTLNPAGCPRGGMMGRGGPPPVPPAR